MIYTSYFAKIRKFPSNVSPVSIARFTPKGVDIPCILELAPTKEILLKYKGDGNTDNYIKSYNEQVLDKYNMDEFISLIEKASGIKGVADSMDKHVALCCFEKSEDFCHRHLIADRLERNNIKVQELDENIMEEIKNHTVELNPLKDGITHINIYSKAETELGRFLTNFAYCPISTDEGVFNSVEAYWGYLKINPDNKEREQLRELYGLKAKQKTNEILKNQGTRYERPDFDDKIDEAIRLKFSTDMAKTVFTKYKDILNLPITHYYYFGDKTNCKIVDVTDKYPQFINSVKTNLKKWIENNKDLLYKQEAIDSDIEKTACFTGRRPKYLFGYNDDSSYLKLTIYTYKVIKDAYDKGYRNFITGGAQGFDQLAFRAVNALKKEHPNENIKNILYLPCKSQSDKWGKDGLFGSDNYKKMLNMADKIRYISDEYTNTCLMDRNKAMIDDSSLVIALYDDKNWDNDKRVRSTSGTLNAINYAKNKHRQINQISFDEHNILDTLETNFLDWDNNVKNNDYLFGINKGILCQQVNCKGVMGAGLAKAIYEQFPIVKEEYIKNSKINKGSLLGTYQLIDVSENLSVCNIYSQENFGNSSLTKKCYTDKNTLINTIDSVCKSNPDRKIYIPVNIGCGLAGANWAEIKEEITALVKKERYQNVYFIDTMQKKAFYIEQTGQLKDVFTDEELNNDIPVIDNEYDR